MGWTPLGTAPSTSKSLTLGYNTVNGSILPCPTVLSTQLFSKLSAVSPRQWRGMSAVGEDGISGKNAKHDTDQELKDLFAEVDTDGSGSIDWEEFIRVIGIKLREKPRPDSADGDKTVSIARLLGAVRALLRNMRGILGTACLLTIRLRLVLIRCMSPLSLNS